MKSELEVEFEKIQSKVAVYYGCTDGSQGAAMSTALVRLSEKTGLDYGDLYNLFMKFDGGKYANI